MQTPPRRDYWPTENWRDAPPQELGMNPAILAKMHEYIEEHLPGLHALLIVHHGYLVFERYYQGFSQKSYHSISSATKSVISALVGVALNQKLITSLDQPMLDFFPDYAAAEQDSRKHAVALRHLLTLQTGFPSEMPREYWRDPVQLALQRPVAEPPGQRFVYDSPVVDILSGILTRVTGKSAAAFAEQTSSSSRQLPPRGRDKSLINGKRSWNLYPALSFLRQTLIAADNIPSQRVAIKNGMIYEKDYIDKKGRTMRIYAVQRP